MNIYQFLQPVDLFIVVAYLLILIAIGLWVSYGKRRRSEENLFLAERSLGWASIGLNMWGTNVGPSMLIASASIGYSTGIVAGNFAWYAFVFILLLAVVFGPRYLGAHVSTLPEFMGVRFGGSTRTILAWYTLITILISWLSLGLFAGGVLVRQLLGFPMWLAVISMVLLATFFAAAGGLKAIAYTNVFQMLLLIAVSLYLVYIGLSRIGGVGALYSKTPPEYWNLFLPAHDKNYPWPAILLGYPVMGVWFWCTEQSMVQSVLGAKSLRQGQLGANFIGWLKILDVPLFIIPGVICYILYPHLAHPDEAYLTLVTRLFPPGMRGLIIVVLVAALVGNIGSSLNSVSTVFTMDIYIKKYRPQANNADVIRIGRWVTVAAALVSVLVALAIDSVKGLNLFDVFQSVLGFLAPPMSAAFLFGVLWKRTTAAAINMVLTVGTLFSVGIGVLYLWVWPVSIHPGWPHFLLLSFYIFVVLSFATIAVSLAGQPIASAPVVAVERTGSRVRLLWIILTLVMIFLYIVFNGHGAKAQMRAANNTTVKAATWIWYPGDYEVWLGNKMQNRRTERGTFLPPFWKLDSHYNLVSYHKTMDLPAADEVDLVVEGEYNCRLDGRSISGAPGHLHIPAGLHTIDLKVFCQDRVPAVFVSGHYLMSDSSWRVTYEDKEWIDASGKVSDKSGTYWQPAGSWSFNDPLTPPSAYRLPTELRSAVKTQRKGQSWLVDFGRETFGFIKLHGLKGQGVLSAYYGESGEEALSIDSCEVLDRVTITKEGDMTLQGSRAFRFVNLVLPPGMQLDSVSMLYEYHPETVRGKFSCNDTAINHIWDIAAYTLQLNTREFFIDGIKRDRWIWSGDAYQSYLMNYYSFFDQQTVTRTLWALRGKDPVTSHINTIMDYSFYWFMGIYDYYMYTGDGAFLQQVYPRMVSLMDFVLSRRNADGWVEGQTGDWVFIDWADGLSKQGEVSIEQVLLYRGLETMRLCAGIAGDEAGKQKYGTIVDKMGPALFRDFWNEGRKAFMHNRVEGVLGSGVTRYANMFGIFFGLLNEQQREAVKQGVLLNDSVPGITTPYMRFYELEALCTLGGQAKVLKEMKDYWGGMLALGATSFWEKYDPAEKGVQHYAMYGRPYGRSLCHAWGASPIYLLGKYYLGIRPATPGYTAWIAEPVLGGLQWMEGTVPTPQGEIRLYCSRKEIRVRGDQGTGVLRLRSSVMPVCKDGTFAIKGNGIYEIAVQPGKEYTVKYRSVE